MAKVITITIRFATGQTRIEGYPNKASGRNLARATLSYFMGLCTSGEVESVTMSAGFPVPEMTLIGTTTE